MQKEELKMSRSLPGGWFESGHGSIAVFVKDFRDPLERKKKLLLRPWASIKDVKDQLQVVFNVPPNAQRLYFQGRELKNAHNLQQCGIYQDNAVVDFVARRHQNLAMGYLHAGADGGKACDAGASKSSALPGAATALARLANGKGSARTDTAANLRPEHMPVVSIHPFGAHLLPVSLMKIMHQALQGLALGLAPVLAMDGTGGTYFLKDPSHRNVGCFKPQDEEPFGPNNPRGLVGELGQSGLRRGILSGEACERELAAYLLDKDHFAGVPATSLVESRHPVFKYMDSSGFHFKMGSLQEFVRHDDVVSDLSPSQFSAHQVHKIVLLDMRLLNTDRNDANILVRKRRSATTGKVEHELIPIDHGYCLPQFLEIAWCDWCWYDWPQLHDPLSPEDRNYVLSLSAQDDADALGKKIPLRRACRRNMIIAGMVVQKGVKANLLLVDIARLMCRDDIDAPSALELLCLEAFRQLQAHKQQRSKASQQDPAAAHSQPPPSSPRTSQTSQTNSTSISRRSSFSLPLTIEIPPPPPLSSTGDSASSNGNSSASNSGARSPPGFWASFAPFGSDEDDEDDRDCHTSSSSSDNESWAAGGRGTMIPSSISWDHMATSALSEAVQKVANGHETTHDDVSDASASSSAPPSASTFGKRTESPNGFFPPPLSNRPRSPTSSFIGNESDQNEFEVLNDALDDSPQDERLFLGILGRLIDYRVEETRQRRQLKLTNGPATR